MHEEAGLSIEELEERTGVATRTIRFYIAEGLLPGPGSRGKGALYREDHLLRLQLIRQLTEQRLPLADVRRRLANLSLEEVRELLLQQQVLSTELRLAEERPSPKGYIAALLAQAHQGTRNVPPPAQPAISQLDTGAGRQGWSRWELAPGLELHVRVDMEPHYQDLLTRLMEAARQRH